MRSEDGYGAPEERYPLEYLVHDQATSWGMER